MEEMQKLIDQWFERAVDLSSRGYYDAARELFDASEQLGEAVQKERFRNEVKTDLSRAKVAKRRKRHPRR